MINVSVSSFAWEFQDKKVDESFEKWFSKNIDVSPFNALCSVNYWPMFSKIAQKTGIKYIAWCYDNPLNVINIEDSLANPVNYVFLFDQIQTLIVV